MHCDPPSTALQRILGSFRPNPFRGQGMIRCILRLQSTVWRYGVWAVPLGDDLLIAECVSGAKAYQPRPRGDGSGRDRTLLRRALGLFAAAGYALRGTELVERKSGRPLAFEIMVTARSDAMDEERMALLFAGQLKRAGIAVQLRPVDAVQFEGRRIAFDFDMISSRWDQSLSPGTFPRRLRPTCADRRRGRVKS